MVPPPAPPPPPRLPERPPPPHPPPLLRPGKARRPWRSGQHVFTLEREGGRGGGGEGGGEGGREDCGGYSRRKENRESTDINEVYDEHTHTHVPKQTHAHTEHTRGEELQIGKAQGLPSPHKQGISFRKTKSAEQEQGVRRRRGNT